ncbi:DUF1654 domain-containing protein [Pseudomonas bohemica]|uniref:DUF1654 domain-containing protein n=1 Tax=Pseudomonas bohemica TaxID=2044872 RepID=UPI000DA63254|nr:DUF1654 domain-containing protein [Pseudomonas bohemica]
MLHQPDVTQAKPRTYEQIGHRIKQIIDDPKVQKLQFVIISRLPNENPVDWRRLLIDMANTNGIRVERLEGESFRVGWREYCEG